MSAVNKTLISLTLAAGALAMAPAHAVVITFGGQTATDSSGLTSSRISANNKPLTSSGYFVETFDPATRNTDFAPGLTSSTAGITVQQGCSFNSFNALGVTVSGGGMGIRSGSTGGAAAPGNDLTCYGFTPQETSSVASGTVKVDYSLFQSGGTKIKYLGFYYGSIDTYNSINFYSSGNTLLQTITGQALINAFNLQSGNRANSNLYVNLDFAANETFSAFEFVTTQRAFELDNVVVGTVPEPESLALVGLGLLGLAAIRRRKQAL